MTRRWMRLAVLLAALAATAGLAYRAFQDEVALHQSADISRDTIDLADRALTTTADLRAAFHAYVAPGQGSPFWVARSTALVEELQTALTELSDADPSEEQVGADAMSKLVAAEKRAREFLRERQELLASDIVFTEIRDQLDAIRLEVAGARDRLAAEAGAREAGLRREQYLLLGAILAAWMLCALLLLPPAAVDSAPAPPLATPEPVDAGAEEMALAPPEPEPIAPPPLPAVVNAPPFDSAPSTPPESPAQSRDEQGRGAPVPRLPEAAQLCVDLARVSDGDQIAPLLVRAADVLDAAGLIVWVTSADAATLVPVAYCGYDERMLARVGALPRDAENLTATAFREAARRTTAARDGAPAAIAVPLVAPTGTIGVLSGEVRHVERIGETTSALASIFAAQLATLVGSMPPAETPLGDDARDETEPASEQRITN